MVSHTGAFWEVRHGALRLQVKWSRFSAASAARWRRKLLDGTTTSTSSGTEHEAAAPAAASAAAPAVPARSAASHTRRAEVEGGADEGDEGTSAKAWVVMEKALAQLAGHGRAPRRSSSGGQLASDGGEAEAEADDSAKVGPGEATFHEELYAQGRVIGYASGVLRLVDLPTLEQLQHGTLTEGGVAFTGPLVIGDEAAAKSSVTRSLSYTSEVDGTGVERLGPLVTMLRRALHRGHEAARQAAVSELTSLLRSSHKESIVCFLFRELSGLYECRILMFTLWDDVLCGLESRTLGFAARADCYLLIRLLLARAEIGYTLHEAGAGGVGQTPLEHVIRWRILQQRTLAWALMVVGEPPAGGDGPALRDFCAATIANSSFRLPQFGTRL